MAHQAIASLYEPEPGQKTNSFICTQEVYEKRKEALVELLKPLDHAAMVGFMLEEIEKAKAEPAEI